MNASVAMRPRLMCRFVQGWSAIAGDGTGRPHGGLGSRHVATCTCCRQFFGRSEALEAGLRREAVRERADAAPDLEGRIVAAVHRVAQSQPRSRREAPLAVLSFVGAAASVALAVFLVQRSPAPMDGPAATGELANAPAGALWSGLPPAADAILNAEPLQREADAVYADARSAVGFLALNFLPSVPRSLATGAEKAAPRAGPIGG